MGILITTVQVPFVRGGGEILAESLRDQLVLRGYRAEVLTNPFRFSPAKSVEDAMLWWSQQDLTRYCAATVDKVIHLKFPCFGAHHPGAVLWLLHQFRGYYELWDTEYGSGSTASTEDVRVREMVREFDTRYIARIDRRYTIARTVSERLLRYNGLSSDAVYHPPKNAELFHCGESLPYIFAPSRLEPLKRQLLLIEAMAHVKGPLKAIIAGVGGAEPQLRARIEELGLGDKVRLVGALTDKQMLVYYANARGVFFAPYGEDYGYVTLEAMLSAKPVITCNDTGGVLEFVRDKTNGLVVEPRAQEVAAAIDSLNSVGFARELGASGLDTYRAMEISWDRVIGTLLS